MDWRAQCAAVIPCLNEQDRVGPVVAGTLRYVSTVLVIDDGSSDQTTAAAEKAGAKVVRHPMTQGKGRALQAGWQWCCHQGFSWSLTLDGDGQHSPEDIPAFFASAEHEHAALVVGNRMSDPRHMPPIRRFVNHWMSSRLSEAAGQPLYDTQCGFRLMDLQAWGCLHIQAAHFEIESEVLLAFAAARRPIRFVPIRVIYENEQSKIRPLRDTLRWWRWWRRT
ncbi:MAG TPA: glycosyltransferase family 2 protein, partial [Clostridia bacterium]|nr:glycosyltransferase family 2 protein [Clostridia bacterium]